MRESKNLTVEQGERKVKQVANEWPEEEVDKDKNPDDLEIDDEEDR